MPKLVPLHWKILERVFFAAGFRFAGQEGSHRPYVKQGILRPIVIPTYDEVPVAVMRTSRTPQAIPSFFQHPSIQPDA